MKFSFMVATRGNPHRALAVIECAKSLASGNHEIEYIVGIDADDVKTYNFFNKQVPDLRRSVEVRPKGVGRVWNKMVDKTEADIYCPFPDDVFIATPDWDELIAQVMTHCYPKKDLGVMCWNDMANPNQCTLPIVTSEWLCMAGQLYDERFPFWFYDTGLAETWSFVTGGTIPIIPKLALAAKKGLTQRMRDLRFWWDVFIRLREERLALAAEIREMLDLTLPDDRLDYCVKMWRDRDRRGMAEIDEMEKLWPADKRKEPTPEYIEAKKDAEKLLAA